MKQKFLRFVSKSAMFTASFGLVFSSLAPLAANAAAIDRMSDTLTRAQISTISEHTFIFRLPTAINAGGGNIAITFPATWAIAGTATSTNFTLEKGTCTAATPPAFTNTSTYTVSQAAAADVWGYTNTSALILTFTSPTSGTAQVFAANDCARIVTTGSKITNGSSTGSNLISIATTSDSGSLGVGLVTSDQPSVTGAVNPTLTFSLGASAVPGTLLNCAAGVAITAAQETLAFGTVTPGSVMGSGTGSMSFICTRITTNATSGANLTVSSLYGSIKDTVRSVTIPTTPVTTGAAATALAVSTEMYGLCATQISRTATNPESATITVTAGFSGTAATVTQTDATTVNNSATNCPAATGTTGVSGYIKTLGTSTDNVWSTSKPVNAATVELALKLTPTVNSFAGSYVDTLTFIATGTF